MTDWKMPRKIFRELPKEIREFIPIAMSRPDWRTLSDMLRIERLLSTPSERGEKETQIINLEAGIQVYKNSVVTLKALLDKRKAKNNEQEKRIEELEKEIEKLKGLLPNPIEDFPSPYV